MGPIQEYNPGIGVWAAHQPTANNNPGVLRTMVTDTDNDLLYGLDDLPKFLSGTDCRLSEWMTLLKFDANTRQTFKEPIMFPYSLRHDIRQV